MIWTTKILAIHPITNELVEWSGDYIEAPSRKIAQQICDNTGRGYMKIRDRLVATVDEETGLQIDYDNFN